VVGGSGVFVNFAALYLFLLAFSPGWGLLRHRLAMALAILLSTETNFLLNNAWTWADRARSGSLLARNVRYIAVSALAGGLQWGTGVLLHERLQVPVFLAQGTGIVVATLLNYALNHAWTFKAR
jgi:putative flippase GtrA